MTDSLLQRLDERRRIWQDFYYHSRTFSLAARLLPLRVRLPIATLYLFCRHIDTIADERTLEVGAEQALSELHVAEDQLNATLHGHPPEGTLWQRLGEVHATFELPSGPLHELIEGARWDLHGRPIEDRQDLIDYSMLVGGSIGAMLLPFLVDGPERRARLDSLARTLGIAMQITNIVRDVGEDLRQRGRVYLPSRWLDEHGIRPAALRAARRQGRVPTAYSEVLERAMRVAETHYADSTDGIDALPLRVRIGIQAAARMYREILNEVRTLDYDNLSERAYVPLPRKLVLIAQDDYTRRRACLMDRSPEHQWQSAAPVTLWQRGF